MSASKCQASSGNAGFEEAFPITLLADCSRFLAAAVD
eukprot:CAMPEP_0170581946 /NCGR_PEP_ID=MMETSP0224-20130122/7316_1 /TAXON_ID=285029 /ORGANISM="Togula jolla, Strain CCCM 725" /LENGTH=36 /DNA_ID= /DNA_START= /DNA_END= /DNA_ORIENTATION=